MGARDYVKPVSSHEAVFVGSTNFPKDLQRYNQKTEVQGKTKELEYCRPPLVWNEPELELTLCIISLQAQT
jgi:hypothetical protein